LGIDAIKKVKKDLHLLLQMGLSNQTLIDEYDEHPEKIFPMLLDLMKLLDAVYAVFVSEKLYSTK